MKSSLSLPQAVDFYLRSRRRLGFALKTEESLLRSVVAFAQRIHHRGPLTEAFAVDWARLPADANPMWWAKRLMVVRGLARFWQGFDPKIQVPSAGVLGSSNCRRPIHIYSPKEISQLLQAATTLSAAEGLRPATFKTLLGLLACTGLRISEALSLQLRDFDCSAATLMIRRSKGGQSRLLPLTPSSVKALQIYQRVRQEYCSHSSNTAFFLSENGKPLSYDQAKSTFRFLRKQLGWIKPPIPRLHDLRHTFAVSRLITWQRRGGDEVNQKILALATYLGHRNIRHTYWYLSAMPELLAIASKRLVDSQKSEAAHD
jgi:integrase